MIKSPTPEVTYFLGEALGRTLAPADWIGLSGDLGAGKTHFTKGIAAGLSIDPDRVTSPTFVILQTYRGRLDLHHLDLYRLHTYDELVLVGYEDLLVSGGACVVEWCDQVTGARPRDGLVIGLAFASATARELSLTPLGARGAELAQSILNAGTFSRRRKK
jgi:tRNA threonylcarbamoyladenosine biosynthesis protein TsaE